MVNETNPPRFDVLFDSLGARMVHHFCRVLEKDENGDYQGCYGTNPHHGLTWEEAKREIAAWYRRRAEEWESLTYEDWKEGMA